MEKNTLIRPILLLRILSIHVLVSIFNDLSIYLSPSHVYVALFMVINENTVLLRPGMFNEDDGSEMQSALAQWTGQRTVPNVFIGGKHIGGCDGIRHYLTILCL